FLNLLTWQSVLKTKAKVESNYCNTRQGEVVCQVRNCANAHFTDLSLWQDVQGLGTPNCSVNAGEMNRKVWLPTYWSPNVWAILGMWQAVHWLATLFSA